MSIRIILLYLFIITVAVYAWRDWFKSLCGLILLMAVIQHPDMPRNIMDIQGCNPWNLLMFDILLAWFVARRHEGLSWDMPWYLTVMLLAYLAVILVGFARMMAEPTGLEFYGTSFLISEHLINTVKWVIPGLLIFDGCRTRNRLRLVIVSVLGLYFLLALLVIRWMPPSSALSGGDLSGRALRMIQNEIGYSRVNMSMLLSGGSWAVLATILFARRRLHRVLILLAFLVVAYGQALTGGRMGYVTWGAVGIAMCMLRWRKYLILVPVVPLAIAIALPGTAERMLQGFQTETVTGDEAMDSKQITASRTLIWPYVVRKIGESPAVGHGTSAMIRTGLRDFLQESMNEEFAHPHNAYLEMLLDNGVIGLVLVLPFYIVVLAQACRLFMDRASPYCAATGGIGMALIMALLVAAIGSQTFYPREGAVGMWCAIGLVLRVNLERSRASAAVGGARHVGRQQDGRALSPVAVPMPGLGKRASGVC